MPSNQKPVQQGRKGHFKAVIKSLGKTGDALLIEGFASTPALDRGGDIVLPSAFENCLDTYLKNPILLWDHGYDMNFGNVPIGRVIEAKVEDGGLRVKAEVTNETIAESIRRGELCSMSFGYDIPPGGWEVQSYGQDSYVHIISELELYEISVVAVPMNASATFSLAKSLKKLFAKSIDETEEESQIQSVTTETAMDEKDEAAEEEVSKEAEVQAEEPKKEEEVSADEVVENPVESPAEEAAPEKEAEAKPEEEAAETEASQEETKAAKGAVEVKVGASEELKSVLKNLEDALAETKSLANDKAVAIEGSVKALTEKVDEQAEFLKKADELLNALTDRFITSEAEVKSLKKRLDETPVENAYAMTNSLGQPAKKKGTSVWDSFSVRTETSN